MVCIAADEVLHSPLVHVRAVEHPLAEILEGGKGPVLLPLAHHGLDKAPADVLHGHQAEADAALLHGEPVIGAVHIRRQQGDAAVLALGDVFGHLVGVVQHRGQALNGLGAERLLNPIKLRMPDNDSRESDSVR